MTEPGIFGAYEPATIPHTSAKAPPKYDFGLDTLGAGWKGGSAGTDYGLHQAAYEGDIAQAIEVEAAKRGIERFGYTFPFTVYDRRVKAAGGRLDVLNPRERAEYDRVNRIWSRIADERKKDPAFLKDYPTVWDFPSLQTEARRRRAVDEDASNEVYAQSTKSGKAAWWLGNFGTAAKDPLSYLPLGASTKAGTTVAGAVVRGTAVGAATNAAVTVALEPAVRIDAAARGQPRTATDTVTDIALSAAFGGLIEGVHGGLEAKFSPDHRAASQVLDRDAEVREASPFERTPAGDTEHGKRLSAAMAALEAGQAVPKFKTRLQSGTSLAGGADRFKAMVRTAESSGDDLARPIDPKTGKLQSSALGRFQFTEETWLTYYKREIGAQGLTDDQILAKRADGALQERLMDALTRDNTKLLAAAGMPDTPTNLYMVHFLGPKGLRVLRAAPETPVETLLPAKFVTANRKVLKGKTAGEVIAWADRKMGGEGVVVEAPDTPLLREDHFADEGEYRAALNEYELTERVPDDGASLGLEEISAFHGSPHEFDRFSMEHVGTGEGAQSYGHGLYFAENERVADDYRRMLAPRPADMSDAQQDVATHYLMEAGGDREQAVKLLYDYADSVGIGRDSVTERTAKHILEPPGRMYEVGIRAKPDELLDWDKPLGEQPERVKQALAGLAARDKLLEPLDPQRIVYEPEMSVPTLLDRIAMVTGDRKSAAEALREQGLAGIKYLDQGSRSVGEGTRNYVIFDDSRIRIKTSEETAQEVIAETEAAGPNFEDPNGPDAVAQVDSIEHDLTAEDIPDAAQFRIGEEGREITVADAFENIARDEAAIKALKDCL